MTRERLILAGGGTGGHLYPGLAVAECLRAMHPQIEVCVFGTGRAIDRQLTTARGYELVVQEVQPLPSRAWDWPRFVVAWRRSVRHALERFRRRPPRVILGLGGYAAAPPIVAASRLGIPTAIFNPDALPGRANRRLARKVDCVFVQWPETARRFGALAGVVQCTGCPVRPGFATATKEAAHKALKLERGRHTLLVTGASQGARSINAAILAMMDLWQRMEQWQIVHLTGPADHEQCATAYAREGIRATVLPFTEHMALCMAAADLVVSRAGASTLAEITAVGRAAVLMPYPYDRHRHQMANANVLADNHAAVIVEDACDPQENARRLRPVVEELMTSHHQRARMAEAASAMGRVDAAEAMAKRLAELGGLSGGSPSGQVIRSKTG